MSRNSLVALALTLMASFSFAQSRGRATSPVPERIGVSGRTVSGIVSSVQGNLVSIAGGLVTIDASDAKITGEHDGGVTLTSVTPGSLIFAVLKDTDVAVNAPLPAAIIGVTRIADAILTGPITSVDPAGSTLTMLSRRIRINAQTTFVAPGHGSGARGLGDLLPNQIVAVEANAIVGALVATSVRVLSPVPLPTAVIHGTVKSMTTESWVINDSREKKDVTVLVNAQTKIAGSPVVGDAVDVIASVDSAHAYVAISIVKSPVISPLPELSHIEGRVKSIGATSWVITENRSQHDTAVLVDAQTKIVGSPKVGDAVEVLARTNDAHALLAISIIGVPTLPNGTEIAVRTTVRSISESTWVLGDSDRSAMKVMITRETKISGSPKVGDRVDAILQPGFTGFSAVSITKVTP